MRLGVLTTSQCWHVQLRITVYFKAAVFESVANEHVTNRTHQLVETLDAIFPEGKPIAVRV